MVNIMRDSVTIIIRDGEYRFVDRKIKGARLMFTVGAGIDVYGYRVKDGENLGNFMVSAAVYWGYRAVEVKRVSSGGTK